MYIPLAFGSGSPPLLISDRDLTRGFKLNVGNASPFKDYVFEDTKTTEHDCPAGSSSSKVIKTLDDLVDLMHIDGSMSVSYGPLSGSGAGHYTKSRVLSKRKMSLIYKAYHVAYFRTPEKLAPAKEYQELLARGGAEALEDLYGTHFVHRIVYGAQLEVKFTITSDEDTDLMDIAAQLEGKIGIGGLAIRFEATFKEHSERHQSNLYCEIEGQYCGVTGVTFPAKPSLDEVEGIITNFNGRYKDMVDKRRVGPVGFWVLPIADHVHGVFQDWKHKELKHKLERCGKAFEEASYWYARLSNALDECKADYSSDPRGIEEILEPYEEQVQEALDRLGEKIINCTEFCSMSLDDIIEEDDYPREYSRGDIKHFRGLCDFMGYVIDVDGKRVPWMKGEFRYMKDDERVPPGRTPTLSGFRDRGRIQNAVPYKIQIANDPVWDQQGWGIAMHDYYPKSNRPHTKDRRDEESCYAIVHRWEGLHGGWLFEQQPDGLYRIKLVEMLGEGNQRLIGALGAHSVFGRDKRDKNSMNVMVHRDTGKEGTKWRIAKVEDGLYAFYLRADHFGFTGEEWALVAHRYYDVDRRDENSTFLAVHRDMKPTRWEMKC